MWQTIIIISDIKVYMKDTERQTGKPGWRLLFVQKKMPPPQTFPDNQTTFSPAA